MTIICKLFSGGFIKAKPLLSVSSKVGSSYAGYIKLTVNFPEDSRRKGYRIMAKTDDYPSSADDGRVFYDSQDVAHRTDAHRMDVTIKNNSNYVDGTKYYFSVFPYTYKYTEKIYTETSIARCTATPIQIKGTMVMSISDVYSLPEGVSTIDLFLVGGGAGGSIAGGGGGGYTTTIKGIDVSSVNDIVVSIGAGGTAGGGTTSAGGATIAIINGVTYQANGADANNSSKGGNGGSGGGGSSSGTTTMYGGSGGSNGSDGYAGTGGTYNRAKGTGQGNTTYSFGDSNTALYAGGGGGCATCYISSGGNYSYTYERGAGGEGGGGTGGATFYAGVATSICGTDGTDGTGGGGGGGETLSSSNPGGSGNGGCGVAIVRWGY